MRNLWPFSRLFDYLDWRRRDREETVVATAEYISRYVDDKGKPTGIEDKHVVWFCIDGNGVRYTRTDTTCERTCKTHNSLITDRTNWKIHANLPANARRTERRGGANLVLLPGGKV